MALTRENAVGAPRAALLRRRALLQAWACIAVGVLIPFLAFGGALTGWRLHRAGDRAGLLALVVGLAVFLTRIALFVAERS